jgi:hypothetical protein
MLNRYRKSVSSLVATVAGWGVAASTDGVYTQQEWWGLGILLAGVVAVWGIPNDPPAGRAADPNVSERGAVNVVFLAALLVIVVCVVWLIANVDVNV